MARNNNNTTITTITMDDDTSIVDVRVSQLELARRQSTPLWRRDVNCVVMDLMMYGVTPSSLRGLRIDTLESMLNDYVNGTNVANDEMATKLANSATWYTRANYIASCGYNGNPRAHTMPHQLAIIVAFTRDDNVETINEIVQRVVASA